MSWQNEEEIDYLVEAAQRAEVQADRNRPREEVMAAFEILQKEAEASDVYVLRCMNCKKKVTGPRYREALGEGHIYSDEGRREFSLSGLCEWCFDKITKEPEEDNPHLLISGTPTAGKKLVRGASEMERKFRGEE